MSVNNYYQKNISNYTMNTARKKNLLALVPDEAKNILDIGCGQGELAKILQGKDKLVSGVDISKEAIKLAEPYLNQIFCFNIEDEKWPQDLLKQKFDCIIASEVIEHLFEPGEFIKKLREILKPQGVLILTTPNFLFWKNRLKILSGRFEYEDSGFYDKSHVHFFTKDSLIKELQKAGFKIDKENHFYPNLYRRGLNFLGKYFSGFLAYQLIIKARLDE